MTFNKKPISRDKIAKRDFLHILDSPGYAPGTIAVNVTWIQCWSNAWQNIPIYLQRLPAFSVLNYYNIRNKFCNYYTGWRKKRGHPISLQIF